MVKCADCGFLALRNQDSFILEEAPESLREAGVGPSFVLSEEGTIGTQRIHFSLPICFARSFNLIDEVEETGARITVEKEQRSAILTVINAERECVAFTIWQPSYSPREHHQMQRDNELRTMVWAREDARDAEVQRRHKEEMDTLKGQHWWQLVIFGGVVVMLSVGATLIGSMIEADWIRKPW